LLIPTGFFYVPIDEGLEKSDRLFSQSLPIVEIVATRRQTVGRGEERARARGED
jgi:hypothetical protein